MVISNVQVETESPDENVTGMIRIACVTSYDENDNIIQHYDRLINYEANSFVEVIDCVANHLNVSTDIIELI